ncbi:MAG TPA: hypothetical protein VHB25_15695 [Gemmatimonadaceae bacterium]|nr:hypothetical protein [Gemmatimonadaceae bacterium]
MPRAFKYDVAITATEYDGLAVVELKRRLEHRIPKSVFTAPAPDGKPRTAATTATIEKALTKDARVVVVLFQRLWGETETTRSEAAALRARIGKTKHQDVVVVPLDSTPVPSWLKATVVRGTPSSDAVVDAVVHAVTTASGSPKKVTEAALAARRAEDEKRARARIAFLTSQRALTMINRELDSLSATVLKLCETPGTLPAGLAPDVRRTPDRYTVQIGPVGLSFSWIRGRSNSIADGQLLVIEWSGTLGEQQTAEAQQAAMPTFEHVLQPHATSPDDWHWRRMDLDLCAYTTRDLAAQCVASVVRRLPAQSA